jgi:hypothetical protein
LNEYFDVKAPRKLIEFLDAIGEFFSLDEPFQISPRRWFGKVCTIETVLKRWTTAEGQNRKRNVITEFMPCD